MFRALAGCVAFSVAAAGSLQADRLNVARAPTPRQQATDALQRAAGAPTPVAAERALIDKYCVTCHNARRQTAGLMLDRLDVANVGAGAETWEKVVRQLRSREMPPAGLPRPDSATYRSLVASLQTALDREAAAHPNPGRAAIHRLNRAEYTNAIRDLLALEIDGRSLLPADDSGYGFDNIADVLAFSPALLDRYMSAAGTVSRLAIGDPSIRPAIHTYALPMGLLQTDRMSEDLPFGSRGGLAVRHYFPVDGEYEFKIRVKRTANNQIRGVGERNELELRLDRVRLKLFALGGDGPINAWAAVPNPSLYEQTADDGLEVRVPVKAGARVIGVTFLRKGGLPEGILEPRLSVSSYEFAEDRDEEMSLGSIQITGPYAARSPEESPSRRRILACEPANSKEQEPCAKKILSTLARRAYRRPVTDQDLQPLLSFYKTGLAKGSFEAGIELALRALLVDPDFLFRVERDPANVPPAAAYRLTDLELASRLSFFLWSSIPDDQLLDLAARGRLKDPAVLEQQVRRMLADRRSSALLENFVGQWLYVRNLRGVIPDPDAFPDFDENLREAFKRETELFIDSQVREDHSVVDLLTANYTFVNERLARHYGIPKIYGNYFRRVTFSDNTRSGLLGQGSVLTVTSYAHRTSPTLRGKWVLQNLLGAPPPPPPANVPSLEENSETGKSLTVRERLEQHRKDPACASCHARMDPIGLALENFDAIGKWRTTEANVPIDASGSLSNGTKLDGVTGLRNFIVSDREAFVATLTERLLTYGLGRGVEYYDAPAVRKITQDAAPGDYRWSSLILGIVESTPFQMRRSQGL